MVGLNFSSLSVKLTGLGSALGLDVAGISASTGVVYTNLGLDWQAGSGFNIGFGYDIPFLKDAEGVPYINVGWFF